jgi:thiamine pyrophosphate-dependent acetolactate synthase large subunit-like protein
MAASDVDSTISSMEPALDNDTSKSLGAVGLGLPAAIGAIVAKSDALVIDVDVDVSFCKIKMEFKTALEFNIGVKVIILNDEEQGKRRSGKISFTRADMLIPTRSTQTLLTLPMLCEFRAERCGP